MEPQYLLDELRGRGLVVLSVATHPISPLVMVVYLHANAGQWVDGWARDVIAQVPGVRAVAESPQTPAILLVHVVPLATGS